MTKLTWVFISLTLISIGVCACLYLKVDHLDSQYHTLGQTVSYYFDCDSATNRYLEIKQFKEDSYIRQQEHDTNLILATFTLLFGAFIGLNIIVSETRFARFKKYITDEASKQASNWQEKHEKLSENLEELQADIKSEVAWLKKEDAKDALDGDDMPSYVFFMFIACKLFTESALYYRDKKHEDMVKTYEESIENTLSSVLDKVKNTSVQMADHDSEDFLSLFNEIRKLNNYKIDNLISLIQPHLIFSP